MLHFFIKMFNQGKKKIGGGGGGKLDRKAGKSQGSHSLYKTLALFLIYLFIIIIFFFIVEERGNEFVYNRIWY